MLGRAAVALGLPGWPGSGCMGAQGCAVGMNSSHTPGPCGHCFGSVGTGVGAVVTARDNFFLPSVP